MTATIAERVARGAAYLDEREPGWWQRIDLDALDLAVPCKCVLGQLDGGRHGKNWAKIVKAFGLRFGSTEGERFAIALGFDRHRETGAELTDAWRALISARYES